jgi:hypothetical protein
VSKFCTILVSNWVDFWQEAAARTNGRRLHGLA